MTALLAIGAAIIAGIVCAYVWIASQSDDKGRTCPKCRQLLKDCTCAPLPFVYREYME